MRSGFYTRVAEGQYSDGGGHTVGRTSCLGAFNEVRCLSIINNKSIFKLRIGVIYSNTCDAVDNGLSEELIDAGVVVASSLKAMGFISV